MSKTILERLHYVELGINEIMYMYSTGREGSMYDSYKNAKIKVFELEKEILRLKPTVPRYVADWFEDNSEGSVKYWVTHFEKHDTPDYVADWLNKQDDFFMTLAKMEEFGYLVEGE